MRAASPYCHIPDTKCFYLNKTMVAFDFLNLDWKLRHFPVQISEAGFGGSHKPAFATEQVKTCKIEP